MRPVKLEVKISPWKNQTKNQTKVEDAVPFKEISAMLRWLTFLSFRLNGFDHRPEAIMFALFFDLLRAPQRC